MRLHRRVDEAPADRRVVDSALREKASVALPCTKGARDIDSTPPAMRDIGFARADRARGQSDRVEAGAAEPVDRARRARCRAGREQQRHARDIAIVLARLIGAAGIDFVDLLSRGAWAPWP